MEFDMVLVCKPGWTNQVASDLSRKATLAALNLKEQSEEYLLGYFIKKKNSYLTDTKIFAKVETKKSYI